MSKSTLNWVEDELFRICGLSDVDAAKFLISIAKEAKSKERCFKNIMKTETLEVDEKFTDELWNRGEELIIDFFFFKLIFSSWKTYFETCSNGNCETSESKG